MPFEQVLAGDGRYGRVFRNARIRIVFAIGEDEASRDGRWTSTSSLRREMPVNICSLGELNFVVAKLRVVQQVEVNVEYGVEVALQAIQRNGGRVRLIVGFDLRGADFEEVVHLVAGLGLCAAGTPDLAVDVGESGLGCRLGDRAAANASGRADQRQFVVGLEEDDHAVRELNARRLGRRKRRQWRRLSLHSKAPAAGEEPCDEKRIADRKLLG